MKERSTDKRGQMMKERSKRILKMQVEQEMLNVDLSNEDIKWIVGLN